MKRVGAGDLIGLIGHSSQPASCLEPMSGGGRWENSSNAEGLQPRQHPALGRHYGLGQNQAKDWKALVPCLIGKGSQRGHRSLAGMAASSILGWNILQLASLRHSLVAISFLSSKHRESPHAEAAARGGECHGGNSHKSRFSQWQFKTWGWPEAKMGAGGREDRGREQTGVTGISSCSIPKSRVF